MLRPSTSKSKAPPSDAEIIEISDDDSPPQSISKAKAKSKSKPTRPSSASGLAPSSATKKFLPKAPVQVIEILDSDDEQLPSKAQPLQKQNVGITRLSQLVQECATGSNVRRGQSQSPDMSSSGRDSFEGSDMMNVDEASNLLQPATAAPTTGSAHSIGSDNNDLFIGRIPLSPPASSPEMQVNDPYDSQASRGLIPLPSSSPSSISFSPKVNPLSSPPPTASTVSPTGPSLSQITSASTISHSVKKPTSAGSYNNQLGFSFLEVPSSLQAPPPPGKHSRQLARKATNQPTLDLDEDSAEGDSEPSGKEVKAQTKMNKGKEREIRQSSSSSSGAESMNMRDLRNSLGMDSEKPKKAQGQTLSLAEAITSAGQLNRMKKRMGRRPKGNTQSAPIDSTKDVKGGVQDEPTVDENEKALKAAIGSSRLLVNLLPSLKEKRGVSPSVIDAAKGDYMMCISAVVAN